MQIGTPRPSPREDGDYGVWVTPGYGNPNATIHLAENGTLDLRDVNAGDCDRLIRAAAKAKDQLLRYQAKMTAPHGSDHFYEGTCQLCGKPAEDGELHADPAPPAVTEARFSITPDALALAESIASGQPVIIAEDEAERCGSRPYPAGSDGDDGTECMLPSGHGGPHDDAPDPSAGGGELAVPSGMQDPAPVVRIASRTGFVAASQPVLLGAKVQTGGEL